MLGISRDDVCKEILFFFRDERNSVVDISETHASFMHSIPK